MVGARKLAPTGCCAGGAEAPALLSGPVSIQVSYSGVRSSADSISQRFWAPCRLIPKALPTFPRRHPRPCGGHGVVELGLQLLEIPAQGADAMQRQVSQQRRRRWPAGPGSAPRGNVPAVGSQARVDKGFRCYSVLVRMIRAAA